MCLLDSNGTLGAAWLFKPAARRNLWDKSRVAKPPENVEFRPANMFRTGFGRHSDNSPSRPRQHGSHHLSMHLIHKAFGRPLGLFASQGHQSSGKQRKWNIFQKGGSHRLIRLGYLDFRPVRFASANAGSSLAPNRAMIPRTVDSFTWRPSFRAACRAIS